MRPGRPSFLSTRKTDFTCRPRRSSSHSKLLCGKLRSNNRALAKALADCKLQYRDLCTSQSNLVQAYDFLENENRKKEDTLKRIDSQAKFALTQITDLVSTLTNILSACGKDPNSGVRRPTLFNRPSRSSLFSGSPKLFDLSPREHNKTKTQYVNPMVEGLTISNPTISLNRINVNSHERLTPKRVNNISLLKSVSEDKHLASSRTNKHPNRYQNYVLPEVEVVLERTNIHDNKHFKEERDNGNKSTEVIEDIDDDDDDDNNNNDDEDDELNVSMVKRSSKPNLIQQPEVPLMRLSETTLRMYNYSPSSEWRKRNSANTEDLSQSVSSSPLNEDSDECLVTNHKKAKENKPRKRLYENSKNNSVKKFGSDVNCETPEIKIESEDTEVIVIKHLSPKVNPVVTLIDVNSDIVLSKKSRYNENLTNGRADNSPKVIEEKESMKLCSLQGFEKVKINEEITKKDVSEKSLKTLTIEEKRKFMERVMKEDPLEGPSWKFTNYKVKRKKMEKRKPIKKSTKSEKSIPAKAQEEIHPALIIDDASSINDGTVELPKAEKSEAEIPFHAKKISCTEWLTDNSEDENGKINDSFTKKEKKRKKKKPKSMPTNVQNSDNNETKYSKLSIQLNIMRDSFVTSDRDSVIDSLGGSQTNGGRIRRQKPNVNFKEPSLRIKLRREK